jgi:transposase
MDNFNNKIKELSTFYNDTPENILKNFNELYNKIKDNVNMKKLIKSRNSLFFNNLYNWKLNQYTEEFWTNLQLCFLLNELNQDNQDKKFVSSLMRSLDKNTDTNKLSSLNKTDNDELNDDINEDLNKINEIVNNIDKD